MGKQKGRERIVSLVLAISMLLSMTGTPAFAVEGRTETSSVSQPQESSSAEESSSSSEEPSSSSEESSSSIIDSGSSAVEPGEKPGNAEQCVCTELCTAEKSNNDCPACKDGFDKCGYIENVEIAVILEKTGALLAWFDARMELVSADSPSDTSPVRDSGTPPLPLGFSGLDAAPDGYIIRGKDGYILTAEDKAYFLECYNEIMALMDALMESDLPAYEQMAGNEDFNRLTLLYRVISNYRLMSRAANAPTVEGQEIYGNGFPLLIYGTPTNTSVFWDKNDNGTIDSSDGGTIATGDLSEYAIYGGSKTDAITANTKVTMLSGKVTTIYGGSSSGALTGNTNIIIKDGVVAYLYGGSRQNGSVSGKATITMDGGTATGSVVGGSHGASSNVGSTAVTINSGATAPGVFGGCLSSDVIGAATVTIAGKVGTVYGGSASGKVGSTAVTINSGGTTSGSVYGGSASGGGTTGSTTVTINGGTTSGSVYGGAGGTDEVTGNTAVIINSGTVTGDIYGGGANATITMNGGSVSRIYGGISTSPVTGNITLNLYGGIVGYSVTCDISGGVTQASGTKKVNVKGNPKIGDKTLGIVLSSLTDKKVHILGALSGTDGDITLRPHTETVSTVVATATNASYATASKFTVGGWVLEASGADIVLNRPQTKPTVAIGSNTVYGNGSALIISGSGNGTTIYWDKNRNGVIDTGDQSLKTAGIADAPIDGTNLYSWSVFGGSKNAEVIGDTLITMLGGQVDSVHGGGNGMENSPAPIIGSTRVNVSGGVVSRNIFGGGGSFSSVSGSTNLKITGGSHTHISGGGFSKANVTGKVSILIQEATVSTIYGAGYTGTSAGSIELTLGNNAKVTDALKIMGHSDCTVNGTRTINVQGNITLGSGANIDLSVLTNQRVNITGELTGANGSIKLTGLTNPTAGTVVATASNASWANADKFAFPDKLLVADSGSIKIGGAMPTVNRNNVFGNGSALIVTGTDDTHTTIYLDKNRNDIVDAGDLSLKAMGIANAPEDNTNLSGYSVYGGSYEKPLVGDTKVTMNGGKISQIFGGGGGDNSALDTTVTGSTNITLNGGTIASAIYGVGGSGFPITQDATININGGTVGMVRLNGSGGGTIGRNATANITGGTILYNVQAAYVTTNTTATVNVSGSPKIGNGTTDTGIILKNLAYENVTINGALTDEAQIYLSLKDITPSHGKRAVYASNAGWIKTTAFSLLNLEYVLVANTYYIEMRKVTAPVVDASSGNVYGNEQALLITADGTGTTIYWDKNRNGLKDFGDSSLKEAGISNAPENGADLSRISVYGGMYLNGTLSLAPLVTMTGGKVDAVIGGGKNGTMSGNTTVTLSGGTVGNVGAKIINVSGNPAIGDKSAKGIDLSATTAKRVTINGALNGTAGAITLLKPASTDDDTVVVTANNAALADATRFTLPGSSLMAVDKDIVIFTEKSPRLYSMGYNSDDAIILETPARTFYKKLAATLYGSAYGGYYRTSDGKWAPILLSSREEAVQWLGVNQDGTTVNNPQSNAGAHSLTFAGQTYYYSTNENTVSSTNAVTGPEDKVYFGMRKDPETAAKYIIDTLPQYAITYDANGGAGATLPTDHKKLKGLPFGLPELALKKTVDGNEVAISGWNTAADGSGTAYDLGGTMTVDENGRQMRSAASFYSLDASVTLYAQFATDKVTVTLEHGSITGTTSVLATKGQMMPTIPMLPIKQTSATFAGYYDDAGTQYYNENGAPTRVYPPENGPATLTARWASGEGIFAGRFSQYQVFDCKRTPAYPTANQPFRVFGFANPFTDSGLIKRSNKPYNGQMNNMEISGKIFYFKPSNDTSNPFILWFADSVAEADSSGGTQVSKAGKIYALGTEGFLFTSSAGNDYGYFISMSQGFNSGDEITYLPTNPGPITEDEANEVPANPNPWDPNESYTVTFNSNGATAVATPSKISVRKPEGGGAVTLGNLPSNPSRTGYTFDGWYTAATGGTEFNAYATPITKSITVYARWVRSVNTTTSISLYKDNSAWTNQTVKVQPVDANNNLTGVAIAAPYVSRSKTYVTASGAVSTAGKYAVLKDGTDTGVRFTHVVGDRDDVEVSYYTVVYKGNGGTGDVPASAVVLEDSTYSVLFTPAPTKTGYTFKGWTDRPAGQQPSKNDGYKIYEQTGAWQNFEVKDTTNLIAVYKQPTPTIGGSSDDFTLAQPETVVGKGTITLNPDHGDPSDYEYSTDGGITWEPWPDDGKLEPEQDETVQIRRPAKGSDLMSDAADATIDVISSLNDLVISENYTGVYDGKPHGITIDKTGGAWDATVTYYTNDTYTTTTDTTLTNVGTKTVYYAVSKSLYETIKGSGTITITKAPLTVTYPGDSVVYTGAAPSLSALTYSGFVNGETVGVLTPAPAVANTNTDPGSYPLTPAGGSAANYSFTYVGGTLTISKASLSSNVSATGKTVTYDGNQHSIAVALTGNALGAAVTYYSDAAMTTTSTNSFQNAGTYPVYYKVEKTGYNDVTGSAQVVINKKPLTPTLTVSGSREYDGTTVPGAGVTTTVALTGVVGNENVTATGATFAFADKNVGTGKTVNASGIELSGTNAVNYTLASTTATATGASITAKEVTLTWSGNAERSYDGQASNVYATVGGLIAGDVCDVTVTGGSEINAGAHTATAGALSNPNYSMPAAATQSYTIKKAMLTATYEGATLIYKDTVPEEAKRVSVTGFVNGEMAATATGYTAPAVTIPPKGADLVYTESLTPAGGLAGNYDFTYVAGIFKVINRSFNSVLVQDYLGEYDGNAHQIQITVDPTATGVSIHYYDTQAVADADTNGTGGSTAAPEITNVADSPKTVWFRVTATGYTSEVGSGTITINPKPVTPYIDSTGTKTYDGTADAPAGITLKLNGLVGTEAAGITGTLAMADKNVGTGKAVSATGIAITNSNYKLTSTTASLASAATVTAKPVNLTWTGGGSLTYTGIAKNVTATIPEGAVVSGDTCSVTVTGGDAKNCSANDYTATATLNNDNYSLTNPTQDYSIAKATLTARFNDESIVYGTNPALGIAVTGFVGGEGATSAAGYTAPTISTSPIPTNVGPHTIALTGGSADNYSFTLQTGTLTITGADMRGEVTATGYTGVYDGTSHVISVAVPSGATVEYYSNATMQNAITNSFTDVADSKTVYYKVTKANYTDVTGNVVVSITKKTLTPSVTASGEKIYNGNTALGIVTGTITLSGVVPGDTVTTSGNIVFTNQNASKNKLVSVTDIAISGTDAGNYQLSTTSISSKTTTAEITPKELALTWADGNLVYTGTEKTVTASLTATDLESQGGIKDICTVTVTGGNKVNVGTHTATAALSNKNYSISTATKTHNYSITKAELTAKFKDEEIVFGTSPALEIDVTGFVNGEDATTAAGYTAPAIGTSPIPTNYGEHPIVINVSGAAADNYSFKADDTGKLKITKARMGDLLSVEGYTGIYDKQPHGIAVTAPANTTITYYPTEADARAGTNELTGGKEKQTNAGKTTVWFKASNDNYEIEFGSEEVSITKKTLVPAVTASGTKVYDGGTALGTATGTLTLTGVMAGETVTCNGNITFVTPNAGENKTVNVTGLTLSGADAGNYELSVSTLTNVTIDAKITQKEVSLNWSGDTDLVYDGNAKNVTAEALGLENGDTCTVTVTGGKETLPGDYTATATELSNPNYKLPTVNTHDYSIAKGTITGVTATPTDKLYDETWSDGVTVIGTRPEDKIWYSTDGGNTWKESIPQVGPVGTTDIMVKVEREHYDDLILGPVTAQVRSAPKVSIGKPKFDVSDVKKVAVSGTVTKGDYPVASQTFEIRKTGTDSWMPLNAGATANGITTYSQLLTELAEDSEYLLRLTATDTQGNTASDTLKFRTQPKTPPTGAIEGTVTGNGSITVTIEMGNTVIATLPGLNSGDRFSFQNLPDGEYNLVATDKDYKITQMVTVKDGKTTQLGSIAIGVKQSTVKVSGDAPPVAAGGLNELFDTPTFTSVPEAVEAVDNGGTVEIRLTADDANAQNEIDEITEKIGTQKIGIMVDLTVDMLITPHNGLATVKNLKTVDGLLTIAIPLPSAAVGKTDYRAYRYHGGVEELTLLKSDDAPTEGSFRIDSSYAYIYSQKFSSYAIAYSEQSGGNDSSDSDAGKQYYTIKLKAGKGGAFNPNKTSVRVRKGESAGFDIIPDEGYSIKDVKLDGKSIGAVSGYLLRNVRKNHTIEALFEEDALYVKPPIPETGGADKMATPAPVKDGTGSQGAATLTDKAGGSQGASGNEKQPGESLQSMIDNLLRDLTQKRDEAITNLPASLTTEERQTAIDEINRIYDQAAEEIRNIKTASEASDIYNQAVRSFEDVLMQFGTILPSVAPTASNPFILASALLALASVLGSVWAWCKKKEEGEKSKKSALEEQKRKRKPVAATATAAAACLLFLLTTGWQGIALANWWTLLVAVPAAASLLLALRHSKQENPQETSAK